jgi:murein DD-endopeptidase MepM/ murein hydrolase activator NlpD
MARFSRIFSKIKARNLHTYFAVELLLIVITGFTAGTNLYLRTNSAKTAAVLNRSLFFVYLKTHSNLNGKLLNAYETVSLKLASTTSLPTGPEVLGASTVQKTDPAPAVPLPMLSGSTMIKPNPASSDGLQVKRDIEVYQVRGGDTLTRIASAYGVTIDTIAWENNISTTSSLKPGQELKILPVSGIAHTVLKGETVYSIAKKYGVDPAEILDYNDIEIADYIQPGDQLIIPNGTKQNPPSPQRQQYLAGLTREDYKKVAVPADYRGASSGFVWPEPGATKLSQGFWSGHPAVDIPCKNCAIVAAADGVVEIAGWQGGYGNTILLNHGNGVTTRYGHGSKLLVTAGEHVKQGQEIMISGSTGHSTGPHLHFELRFNGQAVNPLNYLHP